MNTRSFILLALCILHYARAGCTSAGFTYPPAGTCTAAPAERWSSTCPTAGADCISGSTSCTFGGRCGNGGCCAPVNTGVTCTGCPSCCRVVNPTFNKQCALSTVLLLDNSRSLDDYCGSVRTAVQSFVNGLQTIVNVGGSVNLGVAQFDYTAKVVYDMRPVTPAYVTTVNNYVGGGSTTAGSGTPPAVSTTSGYCNAKGGTNWAAGLYAVQQHNWQNIVNVPVDVFVWFTDGWPFFSSSYCPQGECNSACYSNVLGTSGAKNYFDDLCVNNSATPQYKYYKCGGAGLLQLNNEDSSSVVGTWGACQAADMIKASGAKLFLVAVGDINGREAMMQLMTGMRVWDQQPSTFSTADYVISSDIRALGQIFSQTVAGLCTCLQSQPVCVTRPSTSSCESTVFDAVVKITTGVNPSSSVWPKHSTIYAAVHYNYVASPNTRIAFEFFETGKTQLDSTPLIVRSDIQNPCLVQRRISCTPASASCTTVTESKLIPRFFVERDDALGGCPPLPTGVCPTPGVTCFTKVYNTPPFGTTPSTTKEMISYIWAFNNAQLTPCAAQAADGTLYEFFTSPSSSTSVRGVSIGTSFDFNPTATCTQPTCASNVELLFLIDELTSCTFADYDAMLSFSYNVIQKLLPVAGDPNFANTKFAIRYTKSSTTCTGCSSANANFCSGCTTALQSLSPSTAWGSLLSTTSYAHGKAGGSSVNYAQVMQNNINNIWPGTTSGVKRQMLTFVCGTDSSAQTDYNNLQALLAANSKNVESWVIGLSAGALNINPLSALSSNNQYAHYLAVASSSALSGYVGLESQLLCPQTSICGPSCNGLCTCGSGTTLVCECPTCSSTNFCAKSTCPGATSGCGAPVVPSCDDSNQCTTDSCDPTANSNAGGCLNVNNAAALCQDAFLCTTDICNPASGCAHTPVKCVPSSVCVTSACDSTTGTCKETPISCDDDNACTTDICDTVGGCVHTPISCVPPSLCETASCDSNGSCQNTPIAGCGAVCSGKTGTHCATVNPNACQEARCIECKVGDTNCATSKAQCDQVETGGVIFAATYDATSCKTALTAEGTTGYCFAVDVSSIRCPTTFCVPLTCDGSTGDCKASPPPCDDSKKCTTDVCTCGGGNCVTGTCTNTPVACTDSTTCFPQTCDPVDGVCKLDPPGGVTCNDGKECTLDSCVEGVGCRYNPVVCEQSAFCFPTSCVEGKGCVQDKSLACTPPDACQTAECREQAGGCVSTNITCSSVTECDLPNGCIVTSSGTPQCTVQNITNLFDFCGVCLGNNADCFFSSVVPVSSVAGIAGGIVAGIVIASIIAALVIFFLTRKGYQYYMARSSLNNAVLQHNPAFVQSTSSGNMVDLNADGTAIRH